VSLSSGKIVPNNVPDKYRERLINFIKHVGGVFATMYYKPLRARIVDPGNFITMYIVNLENGEICLPKKSARVEILGNLTFDEFFNRNDI